MRNSRNRQRQCGECRGGFSLVELLIVAAIIALLTGIAAVNYQYAQARAKVARVHADMRTIAEALEQYHMDRREYPAAAEGDRLLERPLDVLTSPVAYLAGLPVDPFSPAPLSFNPALTMSGYQYKDSRTTSDGIPGETYGAIWRELPDKRYYLHSAGPNRMWDVTPYVEYDPTNGMKSLGDVTRFGPM